jgi:hypothetical protein
MASPSAAGFKLEGAVLTLRHFTGDAPVSLEVVTDVVMSGVHTVAEAAAAQEVLNAFGARRLGLVRVADARHLLLLPPYVGRVEIVACDTAPVVLSCEHVTLAATPIPDDFPEDIKTLVLRDVVPAVDRRPLLLPATLEHFAVTGRFLRPLGPLPMGLKSLLLASPDYTHRLPAPLPAALEELCVGADDAGRLWTPYPWPLPALPAGLRRLKIARVRGTTDVPPFSPLVLPDGIEDVHLVSYCMLFNTMVLPTVAASLKRLHVDNEMKIGTRFITEPPEDVDLHAERMPAIEYLYVANGGGPVRLHGDFGDATVEIK